MLNFVLKIAGEIVLPIVEIPVVIPMKIAATVPKIVVSVCRNAATAAATAAKIAIAVLRIAENAAVKTVVLQPLHLVVLIVNALTVFASSILIVAQ